jgi:hypothetical protein
MHQHRLLGRLSRASRLAGALGVTMLKGVVRGTKKPPRIVLYGPPKIGKSTLGSEADKPIFVTTEDGVDNLPVDQFPRADSWETFLANVAQVANDQHEYKTLVIDTINGAVADLAAQSVCAKQFKGDWGPKGFAQFGQGWAATSEEVKKLLPLLDACRARGMTVLMLAHTGVTNVKNPVEGDFSKYQPDLDRRVWARFAAWADIIIRADFEYSVVEKGGKRVSIGTNTRILYCTGSQAEDAGCRVGYDLPETLPLSWSALSAALGQDNGTAKQIKELWGLMPKDEALKALKFLGLQSIDEIEKAASQKAKQILNRLRVLRKESEAA